MTSFWWRLAAIFTAIGVVWSDDPCRLSDIRTKSIWRHYHPDSVVHVLRAAEYEVVIEDNVDKAVACLQHTAASISPVQAVPTEIKVYMCSLLAHVSSSSSSSSSSIMDKYCGEGAGVTSPYVTSWDLLGPFITGKMEFDGDPTAVYSIAPRLAHYINMSSSQPAPAPSLYPHHHQQRFVRTEYTRDVARWRSVDVSNTNGMMTVDYSDVVQWSDLIQTLSSMTLLEYRVWAIGRVYVAQSSNYVIQCTGVTMFYVDDELYHGDIYQSGVEKNSVFLTYGLHIIRMHIKVKHTVSRVGCTVRMQPQALIDVPAIVEQRWMNSPDASVLRIVSTSSSVPDITSAQLLSHAMAVVVQNTDAHHPVAFVSVDADHDDIQVLLHPSVVGEVVLLPSQTMYLPVHVNITSPSVFQHCPLRFRIRTTWSIKLNEAHNLTTTTAAAEPQHVLLHHTNAHVVSMECRELRTQSFTFTFIDHDGSVNDAAVILPPSDSSTCDPCPIIVSEHGTGVSARSMADSFKRGGGGGGGGGGGFEFGVHNAYVLSVTRFGAHNWQYVGMMSAFTAITALVEFTRTHHQLMRIPRAFDSAGVVATGHSMGGGGAWVMGTHYPDRIQCLAPHAAWIRKETYGDSNRLFDHDQSDSFMDAYTRGVFASTVDEYNSDVMVTNVLGGVIPRILSRVGADDKTVHPWFLRRMHRLIDEWQQYIGTTTAAAATITSRNTLIEVPGKQHWWWDTRTTNDGGVNNDKKMRKFYRQCIQQITKAAAAAGAAASAPRQSLRSFVVSTMNPGTTGSVGGVRVLQQMHTARLSRVHVTVVNDNDEWRLKTRNVARIVLSYACARVIIDNGEAIEKVAANTHLCHRRRDGTWNVCGDDDDYARMQRTPQTYGPARQVYQRPFIIVVGTGGGGGYMWRAARLLANLHSMAAHTFVRVMSDIDAIALEEGGEEKGGYNVVVIGDESVNMYTRRYVTAHPSCPFHYNTTTQSYHHQPQQEEEEEEKERYDARGGDVGVLYLAPILRVGDVNGLALVLGSHTVRAMMNILRLAEPTIPPMVRAPFTNLVPDYVVVCDEMRWMGLGGVRAAGWFDRFWRS